MKGKVEESRRIACSLYLSWLETHDLIDFFEQPITVPNVYYQKNWQENTIDTFEQILTFLSIMGFFHEASGTYVLKENFVLRKDNLEQSLEDIDFEKEASHSFITYCLELFDEQLEGGTGMWNKNRYILLENLYTSRIYANFTERVFHDIFNSDSIKDVLVLGLYHEHAINNVISLNILPENVKFLTFTSKLIQITRSYTELTNKGSYYSNCIITPKQAGFQADAIFLSNGIGQHFTIPELTELLEKYSKNKCKIWGVHTFNPQTYLGVEPMMFFLPDFKQMPEETLVEKFLITKGYQKFDHIEDTDMIYTTQRESKK